MNRGHESHPSVWRSEELECCAAPEAGEGADIFLSRL